MGNISIIAIRWDKIIEITKENHPDSDEEEHFWR